jgi:hypothetical protein
VLDLNDRLALAIGQATLRAIVAEQGLAIAEAEAAITKTAHAEEVAALRRAKRTRNTGQKPDN